MLLEGKLLGFVLVIEFVAIPVAVGKIRFVLFARVAKLLLFVDIEGEE